MDRASQALPDAPRRGEPLCLQGGGPQKGSPARRHGVGGGPLKGKDSRAHAVTPNVSPCRLPQGLRIKGPKPWSHPLSPLAWGMPSTRRAVYLLRYVPVGLIALYRGVLSPLWPPACRFFPSCSHYAQEAFEKHGVLKGGFLTLRRLSKCHPFHPGGYDPVP